MDKIQTLKQFYESINQTIEVRKTIVNFLLKENPIPSHLIAPLEETLLKLESIPQINNAHKVFLSENRSILLDLHYEINELKKDLLYIKHGEDAFLSFLNETYTAFNQELNETISFLNNATVKTFITDRDGTINNYCGRYASSIQSIYNAIFLTRFAQKKTKNAVILTSAPLINIGLADISVAPSNIFIYAGSKGREYINKKGQRCNFPIEQNKQRKLNEFNEKIIELVKIPSYERFSLIGSGLQFKFGQTTIARQDISKTIPKNESQDFLNLIKKTVALIDPQGNYFRIEDTGLDIEIILTIAREDTEGIKDFDKGDGVKFLNKDIGLNMTEGDCLICGDTHSDIPMISAAMALTNKTYVIFVTKDEKLKAKVKSINPSALFVSEPDVLVAALNKLSNQ